MAQWSALWSAFDRFISLFTYWLIDNIIDWSIRSLVVVVYDWLLCLFGCVFLFVSLNYCNTSFYGLWGFFLFKNNNIVFGFLLNLKIFLHFGFYSSFFWQATKHRLLSILLLKKSICNPQIIMKKSVFSVTPNFSGHKTAVVNFDFVCNLADQLMWILSLQHLYGTLQLTLSWHWLSLSIKKKRKKI